MKVGIMTFHRAINYGAVLQAFALCKFINNMGVTCEVIDYHSIPLNETYRIFDFKKNNPIVGVLKGLIKGNIIVNKKNKFKKFVNNYISLSEIQYEKEELKSLNNKYDLFITGSDQVWSPNCVGFDEAYFLTFAEDKKKNSYAASIGCKSIPENKREEYKKRLSGYKNISLREINAVTLLKEIGVEADMEVNIDPTFLLSSDTYNDIAVKPSEEKYVLVFSVNMPVNLLEYAKKLAALKNLKVIYINDKPIMRVKGIEYKAGVSPEEFLGYIKNAEYVVTNSFHGTVFSVIFHKQFFVEYNTKNGRNSRSEELLNKLNITGRELINEKPIDDAAIDWESVDNVINNERIKSMNYIKKIIEG